MRHTTIRKALTEAAEASGTQVTAVRDIRVRKGTKANGGAVKLVDATLATGEGTFRLTSIATEALRDTPAARKALAAWVCEVIAEAPASLAVAPRVGRAEAIRDIAASEATGPVCGRETATGDACSRPSADGSACWQHGGDAARQGLVAKSGGNVRPHTPKAQAPTQGLTQDQIAAIATAVATAAAQAVAEALAAV